MDSFVNTNTVVAVALLILSISMKKTMDQRLHEWLGVLFYGLALISWRIVTALISIPGRVRRRGDAPVAELPPVPTLPDSTRQIISRYRLKPAEVVYGFNRARPIKINFTKHHTIIGSSTGGGKTVSINSILIQLLSKGEEFYSKYDIVLIDLKGDTEEDFLNLWEPVVFKYFSIAEGDIDAALAAIHSIVLEMKRRRQISPDERRRMIVIIDEVIILTRLSKSKEGSDLLMELATQGRSTLTLIAATHNPHHSVMETITRHNFTRRIMMKAMDMNQAVLILGFRPKEKDIPKQPGHFILSDPERGDYVIGRVMMPDIPGDIEKVVGARLHTLIEGDGRLQLYREVASGKKGGASVVGIQALCAGGAYMPERVTMAYRHFKQAGAFSHSGRKGQPYKLAVPFSRGVARIKDYIEAGQWENGPEMVISNGK